MNAENLIKNHDAIFADIQQVLRHANSNLEKIWSLFLLGVAYEKKEAKNNE